jgi:hypothetical protein
MKILDFALFKEAYKIIYTKNHLTPREAQGLDKIREISSGRLISYQAAGTCF